MPAWAIFLLSLALSAPAAVTIVRGRERTRVERARAFERELSSELLAQASGLDRLVAVLGGLADSLDGDRVLMQAATEAVRLLDATDAVLLTAMADGILRPVHRDDLAGLEVADPDRAAIAVLGAVGGGIAHATPFASHNELIGVLVVVRQERDDRPPVSFSPAELAQLRVLADFAARAAQNARLYARLGRLKDEAERRERERARLSNQLAEAEQAERRRLALLLHDGPQQTITSAALLLDACIDALDEDDPAEVHRILGIARQRNRDAVRDLRELGWSLEPPALREQGITAALLPLAERLGEAHNVRFSLDLEAAERLDSAQQTFVYQIVREAVANAVKHAQPATIGILSVALPDGRTEIRICDDGPGMQRDRAEDGMSQGLDAMRERTAALGGTIEWLSPEDRGTVVRLLVPPLADAGLDDDEDQEELAA
jgi:signal transduction histidine kinase